MLAEKVRRREVVGGEPEVSGSLRQPTGSTGDDVPTNSVRQRSRRVWALLAVVYVVALSVRCIGVRGVLPYLHHPDEIVNEHVAVQVAHSPTKSPAFFNYPSLLFYTQAVVIRATEWASGAPVRAADVVSQGNARTDDSTHWVAGRVVTAGVSAATAALATLFVVETGAEEALAALAGLAVSASAPLVEQGHYITPDSYAAFFVMAALLASARIARGAGIREYLAAGVYIGLASGSKYNLALAAVAVVVAHCVEHGPRSVFDHRLIIAGCVALAAFLLSTPFALLDSRRFVEGLTYEAVHYRRGHAGSEGGALAYYLRFLGVACGPWAVLSLGSLLRRGRRAGAVPLLTFVAVYVAFISSFRVHFERNAIPLVAPLIALGVVGASALVSRSAAGLRQSWRGPVHFVALGAVFLVTAAVHVAAIRRETREACTNHRASAERWIHDHIPPGSRLVVEGYGPWIDPRRYHVRGVHNLTELSPAQLRSTRYAVVAEQMYGRFTRAPERYPSEAKRYRSLMRDKCELRRFTDGEEIRVFDLSCEAK